MQVVEKIGEVVKEDPYMLSSLEKSGANTGKFS